MLSLTPRKSRLLGTYFLCRRTAPPKRFDVQEHEAHQVAVTDSVIRQKRPSRAWVRCRLRWTKLLVCRLSGVSTRSKARLESRELRGVSDSIDCNAANRYWSFNKQKKRAVILRKHQKYRLPKTLRPHLWERRRERTYVGFHRLGPSRWDPGLPRRTLDCLGRALHPPPKLPRHASSVKPSL